ncbi:putative leader peptide [Qaidamihabitans albus]
MISQVGRAHGPALVQRRHVDLLRVNSAACRPR